MEEETPLSHEVVCFQMLDFKTSKSKSEVMKSNSNILVERCFFLKNYITSEGAVSYNVLYYQQLSIAGYQVSFSANNYFEQLSIVSSAFKGKVYIGSSLVH